MKRYFCTVAAGLLLAFAGSGTAAASLPVPDLPGTQTGTQSTSFGDQAVGEQRNDADVNQLQGNGNLNISPAIAIGGDASTENAQGNDNSADATVEQDNTATQSQSSEQTQSQYQGDSEGSCCDGQSQTGEQKTAFGDQTVGEQKNDADVTQEQGNGNVNVSPAIAVFGDATTKNAQGNDNEAYTYVDQSNEAHQSQDSTQEQRLGQNGGSCCDGQSQTGEQHVYGSDQTVEKQKNDADVTQKQGNGNVNVSPALAIGGDATTRNYQGNHNKAAASIDQSNTAHQSQSADQSQYLHQSGGECCEKTYDCESYRCEPQKETCCDGQSQTGEQKTAFGDQTVGEQKNDADVNQYQGNGNLNVSPAIAVFGDASTKNAQGNGNRAYTYVDQSNEATQSQSAKQSQNLEQRGGGCCNRSYCKPSYPCEPKQDWGKQQTCCEQRREQTGEQHVYGGDQTVEKQKNDADVTQKQGNYNVSYSPALAFGGKHEACNSKCRGSWGDFGGDASTWNAQGNGNDASTDIDQSNAVEQSQWAGQRQRLVQSCKEVILR